MKKHIMGISERTRAPALAFVGPYDRGLHPLIKIWHGILELFGKDVYGPPGWES